MSSNDESAPSPVFGASSSKDCASVTPIASESDSDGGAKKKVRQYKFPRVKWDRVISITKGADAEMYDEARSCLLYTSPSPRDAHESRMPSSA